ncbi:MAG: putative sulfate exporter family transporter [Polaromonas sp.]
MTFKWRFALTPYFPGVLVCLVIALAATFISEHYGGPQLLYALLIGLAFHFLNSHPQAIKGINFCGRTVLRFGVALLGARITLSQVAKLGVETAVVVVLAVLLTIVLGVLLARWLKCSRDEGLLTGGGGGHLRRLGGAGAVLGAAAD